MFSVFTLSTMLAKILWLSTSFQIRSTQTWTSDMLLSCIILDSRQACWRLLIILLDEKNSNLQPSQGPPILLPYRIRDISRAELMSSICGLSINRWKKEGYRVIGHQAQAWGRHVSIQVWARYNTSPLKILNHLCPASSFCIRPVTTPPILSLLVVKNVSTV